MAALARSAAARCRRTDLVLVAAVIGAAVLRLWGIGEQSVWYDEWRTVAGTTNTLQDLKNYVTGSAGIPPTYFGFMWVWARVVGGGDAALRLFSALAGVALVPMVWVLVGELRLSRRVGRVAAVLVAVNPMLVWYSQEARPYTLFALLATVSLWALVRAVERGRRFDLALWVFAATITVAVHYYAAFLVVVEAGLLLAFRRRDVPALLDSLRRPWTWFRPLAPSLVVIVLLAPFAVIQLSKAGMHQWIRYKDFGDRLRGVGTSFLVGPSEPTDDAWKFVAAVALVAVALVVVRGTRRERRVVGLGAVLCVGALTVVLLAKLATLDAVLDRYLIGVLVPALLVVAVGLAAERLPAVVPLVGVAVVSVVSVWVVSEVAADPELQRADWRAVAAAADVRPSEVGERLLVFDEQGSMGSPLMGYLAETRVLSEGETVQAEQIDVVVRLPGTERPCNGLIGRDCNLSGLGDPLPEPVASRFHPVGRTGAGRMAVDHYVADTPEAVTREDLVAPTDDGEWQALVLASPPGAGG